MKGPVNRLNEEEPVGNADQRGPISDSSYASATAETASDDGAILNPTSLLS